MDTVCRLCTRQSGVFESVFSFQNNRLVTDLIAIICPVRIEFNDEFSKKICEECLEIVISAAKLRETSVKSDILFRTGKFVGNQVQNELITTEFPITIKQEKEVHQEVIEADPFESHDTYDDDYSEEDWFQQEPSFKVENTVKPEVTQVKLVNQVKFESQESSGKYVLTNNDYRWPCPKGCGKSFAHQTNIMRHVRTTHDPVMLPFGCDFCMYRFKNPARLKSHLLKYHGNGEIVMETAKNLDKLKPVVTGNQALDDEEQGTFECDFCGRIYNKKSLIIEHLKAHHMARDVINKPIPRQPSNGLFQCDLCDKTFSFIGNMTRHKSRFHSQLNPFPCALCTDRFKNLRRLELHHHKCHREEDFFQCQGYNIEESALAAGAICDYCGEDFKGFRRQLEAHLLKQHSSLFEPLKCHLCPKLMAFPETLKTHINTHKKKIKNQSFPHGCNKCGQRFLKEESLTRHMQNHTEIGFTCHVCGKSLSCAQTLDQHLRRHEDQKGFFCPQCPSQFVTLAEFERHKLVHSSDRDFPCELCPLTFKSHEILKKHMKRVHYKTMERNLSCDFCLKKFYTSYSLERHVRTHTETF